MHKTAPSLIVSPGIIALVVALLTGLAIAPATAAERFSQQTTAKRYNFTLVGHGGDGSVLSAVGWFEATNSNGSQNIVAGAANIAFSHSGGDGNSLFSFSLDIDSSLSPLRRILVRDATNGIYDMHVTFETASGPFCMIQGPVLLDNAGGRTGKVSVVYDCRLGAGSSPIGQGAASGQIAEQ